MTDLQEKAMRMALERLELHEYWMDEEAIQALRQALDYSTPEQIALAQQIRPKGKSRIGQALAQPVDAANMSQERVDETAKREHEPVDWEAVAADQAMTIAMMKIEQEPVGTYEEVMETMLSLRKGTFEQQQIYVHMKDKPLYTAPPKREWVGLMKGVRVEGDKVIIVTKNNDMARELCGKLIEEKNT